MRAGWMIDYGDSKIMSIMMCFCEIQISRQPGGPSRYQSLAENIIKCKFLGFIIALLLEKHTRRLFNVIPESGSRGYWN